jgi:hypothetical protein
MAIQTSVAMRNAMLNTYEWVLNGQTAGTPGGTATAPKLILYSGTKPADCATAISGQVALATLTLTTDFMAAASAGSIAKTATAWTVNGAAAGTASFYRFCANDGTTCHEQGTVGVGTGDLQVNQTSVAVDQPVTITAWNRNMNSQA